MGHMAPAAWLLEAVPEGPRAPRSGIPWAAAPVSRSVAITI